IPLTFQCVTPLSKTRNQLMQCCLEGCLCPQACFVWTVPPRGTQQEAWGWAGTTGLNLRNFPNEILQLLALTMMFAPTLDDAQEFGMLRQKPHQIVRLTTLYRMTVVVEGTKYHLHRDPFQRFAQDLCHLLADRQQHRIENQGGVDLQLHGIGGARPQVRQIQHPLAQHKRILEPPASPA